MALFDALCDLITELVLGEDGRAQERSLLQDLLPRIPRQSVIVADRNFYTTGFVLGLVDCPAFFVIRQHAQILPWKCKGQRRRVCRTDMGEGGVVIGSRCGDRG